MSQGVPVPHYPDNYDVYIAPSGARFNFNATEVTVEGHVTLCDELSYLAYRRSERKLGVSVLGIDLGVEVLSYEAEPFMLERPIKHSVRGENRNILERRV